jgi:hypothetical protein
MRVIQQMILQFLKSKTDRRMTAGGLSPFQFAEMGDRPISSLSGITLTARPMPYELGVRHRSPLFR